MASVLPSMESLGIRFMEIAKKYPYAQSLWNGMKHHYNSNIEPSLKHEALVSYLEYDYKYQVSMIE